MANNGSLALPDSSTCGAISGATNLVLCTIFWTIAVELWAKATVFGIIVGDTKKKYRWNLGVIETTKLVTLA